MAVRLERVWLCIDATTASPSDHIASIPVSFAPPFRQEKKHCPRTQSRDLKNFTNDWIANMSVSMKESLKGFCSFLTHGPSGPHVHIPSHDAS